MRDLMCHARLLLALLCTLLAVAPAGATVRQPAVAGSFYPAEAAPLQEMVDRFLGEAAATPAEGELLALIVPHAGYVYSGPTAAAAYRRLRDSGIRRVILVGPAHRVPLRGIAVHTGEGWATPLGTVPVDTRLARELLDSAAGISDDRRPFDGEHSLEVQLPFLQRVLGDFTIVPILVGAPDARAMETLAARLATVLRDAPGTLLVCSTDLSHYHSAAAAHAKDGLVVDAVRRMAFGDLAEALHSGRAEACGEWPLQLAMAAARGAGATNGTLFRYADSGEAGGERQRVVGYAAMGLYRTPLTAARRTALLKTAREAVSAQVNGTALPAPACDDPRLAADGAAFVTLRGREGALRGCIGTIQSVEPLCRSVQRNAVAAASRDRRFRPVGPTELAGLDVEVTVLSPLEPVAAPEAIRIGTHGVYLEAAGTSSVFLPQVAPEQGWDLATTLRQLALKAGLPADGWREGRLYRFTAEIIHTGRDDH